MKKHDPFDKAQGEKGSTPLLIVIGVLLIVAAVGYFAEVHNSKQLEVPDESGYHAEPSGPITPDSGNHIASWKTFSDPEIGIAFDYPSGEQKYPDPSQISLPIPETGTNLVAKYVQVDASPVPRNGAKCEYLKIQRIQKICRQMSQ
jgi:hypothetical protein